MRLLILTVSLCALAYARPEMYKEKEDFQFSRSSSDDGSKSGYYGAQRGNMGGNYEKAHNMDSLAQHQMSTLVRQVDGELGEGSNTRTGSVYTAGNSRGIYGSGQYDLSNLKGRNFEEGAIFGDSHSLSSQSAGHSENSYSAANNARYSASHLRALGRNSAYETTGHTSQYGQFDNQQIESQHAGASNYEYGSQGASNYKHYYYGGSQARSEYDQRNNNLQSLDNYNGDTRGRLITTPVRVYVRPGTRVTIPVAAQTYDASQSSLMHEQNAINSDSEVVSNNEQEINVIKPVNRPKHYESSYRYRKEWEKHDTIPVTVIPTINPFPKNSELYEDTQLSQAAGQNYQSEVESTNAQLSRINSAYSSHINSGHSSGYSGNTKSAATNRLQYQSQLENSGAAATSNAYTLGTHSSGTAGNLNSLVDSTNLRPKSYQSSYSYHKSWERRGDPYVIKPVGEINGQASQRLLDASATGSNVYSSMYGKHRSQMSHSHDDCDEEGHLRMRRSYNLEPYQQMYQPNYEESIQQYINNIRQQLEYSGSQTLYNNNKYFERLDQQSQNQWNFEDLGQQTQNKWDNLESLNQYAHSGLENLGQQSQSQLGNLEDLGQQTQNNWDNLESLNQHPRSDSEDLGQQSQSLLGNLEDLGQQTQNKWDNLESLNQHPQDGSEDLGQQSQSQLGNLEDLGQQTQNKWDNLESLNQHPQDGSEDLGQQSQSQLGNLEDLGQQTQNKWDNLDSLNQHPQSGSEDLGQQSQSQLGNLEDLGQQTQNKWDNLESLNQHPQSGSEALGQQSQSQLGNLEDLGQQTQNKWDNLESMNQHSQSDSEDLGQQSQSQLGNLEDLGQQTQNKWDNSDNQQMQNTWNTIEDQNLRQIEQQVQGGNFEQFENQNQQTNLVQPQNQLWNKINNLEQSMQNYDDKSKEEHKNSDDFNQQNLNPWDNLFEDFVSNQATDNVPATANNGQNVWDTIDKIISEIDKNDDIDSNTSSVKKEENHKINVNDHHTIDSYHQYHFNKSKNTVTEEEKKAENKNKKNTETNSGDTVITTNKKLNTSEKENNSDTQEDIKTNYQINPDDFARGDIGPDEIPTVSIEGSGQSYGISHDKLYKTQKEVETLSLTHNKKDLDENKLNEEPVILNVIGLEQYSVTTTSTRKPTVDLSNSYTGLIDSNDQTSNQHTIVQYKTQSNFNADQWKQKETQNTEVQTFGNIEQQNFMQQSEDIPEEIGNTQYIKLMDFGLQLPINSENMHVYSHPKFNHFNRDLQNEKIQQQVLHDNLNHEPINENHMKVENVDSLQSEPKNQDIVQAPIEPTEEIGNTQYVKLMDFGLQVPINSENMQVYSQAEFNHFNSDLQNEKIQQQVLHDNLNQEPINENQMKVENVDSLQSEPKNQDIVQAPIEPPEKEGFWKSAWGKTVKAKDSVVSWFKHL